MAWLPETIVDSGNQWGSGWGEDSVAEAQQMVDHALTRPPTAEMASYWWRDGARMRFYVRVKNLAGKSLYWANGATVHAIAYENARVVLTGRYVRDARHAGVEALSPGGTDTFTLASAELQGVDWTKMAGVTLLDYRPDGWDKAYDTAQAALAQRVDTPFAANPKTVALLVDPADEAMPPAHIRLSGIPGLEWTAHTYVTWLEMNPLSGSTGARSTLTPAKESLSPGRQITEVVYTTAKGEFTQAVRVEVYYGPVSRVHLPVIMR